MVDPEVKPTAPRSIRWWPAVVILLDAVAALAYVRSRSDFAFQQRNLISAKIVIVTTILFVIWWMLFSRAPKWRRWGVTFGVIGLVALGGTLFRIRGVSGDLVPILEFRWARAKLPTPVQSSAAVAVLPSTNAMVHDFPQFLGPNRDGVLAGPRLETNWTTHPPEILWRQPLGPARSGFVVVGNLAITQEQRGEQECVVAYELTTGKPVWLHTDPEHYNTTIAGEGPHATPTVVSNRVYSFGATGRLSCLELATGRAIWTRNIVTESGGVGLDWGCSSSPLVVNDLVMVEGGKGTPHSLFAVHTADGKPAWSVGNGLPGYAAPIFAELAGAPQVISFNHRSLSAHDPAKGTVLWQTPWGNGNVVCSTPVLVSSNRVLCSSGYGAGAGLFEISRDAEGKFSCQTVWKSIRMKAKFSHLFARAGFLYGLDDGIYACVDLADGSQRWKEGRYGHGQGLAVGELYLLMAEAGELVLLRPTPEAPNELTRFPVFNTKTWNPPALAGGLLLVRNEQEAVCLRLKVQP